MENIIANTSDAIVREVKKAVIPAFISEESLVTVGAPRDLSLKKGKSIVNIYMYAITKQPEGCAEINDSNENDVYANFLITTNCMGTENQILSLFTDNRTLCVENRIVPIHLSKMNITEKLSLASNIIKMYTKKLPKVPMYHLHFQVGLISILKKSIA